MPADASDALRETQQQSISKATAAFGGCALSSIAVDLPADSSAAQSDSTSVYNSSAFQSGKSDIRTFYRLTPPCGNAELLDQGQLGPIKRCWIGIVMMDANNTRSMHVDVLQCDGNRAAPTPGPSPTADTIDRTAIQQAVQRSLDSRSTAANKLLVLQWGSIIVSGESATANTYEAGSRIQWR